MSEAADIEGKRAGSATLFWVWIALLAFTFSSFAVASFDLGVFDLVATMSIAGVKATLVTLFFMHLREQRFANRIVVLVSVLFVIILVALTAADVATR